MSGLAANIAALDNINEQMEMIIKIQGASAAKKKIIEGKKTTIIAWDLCLDLHRIVPWKTYLDTLKELNRSPMAVVRCEKVVGEVKTLIENAVKNNVTTIKTGGELCDLTIRLLDVYSDLFGKRFSETYKTQQPILIKPLMDGLIEISVGQAKLKHCFKAMKDDAKKLKYLTNYIHGPFGAIVKESIAAGAAKKNVILELTKKFDEMKDIFENLDKTLEENKH